MPVESFTRTVVEKQWVKILTVDPRTRHIEGILKDYAVVRISLWEVPPTFRWPKENEVWLIVRENNDWFLRAPMQEPDVDHPIEDISPGDTQLGQEGARIYAIGQIRAKNMIVGGYAMASEGEGAETGPAAVTDAGYVGIGGVLEVVGEILYNGEPIEERTEDLEALLGGIPLDTRTLTNWHPDYNRVTSIDRNSWTNQNLFDFIATLVYDLKQSGLME